MIPEEFTLWLKAFVDATNDKPLTNKQWKTVKETLEMVENYDEPVDRFELSGEGLGWVTTTTNSNSYQINYIVTT